MANSAKQRIECLTEWLKVREQKTKVNKPAFSKNDVYKHHHKTKGII